MRWPAKALLILAILLPTISFTAPYFYLSGSRQFEQVIIPADGYRLTGYLSPGTNPEGPWVIFGHGNRAEGQAHPLYQGLTQNLDGRVTVLAIDFRGFGQSPPGNLAAAESILDRSQDYAAAVAYLKTHRGATDERIVLMGHSFGAAQALKAAQQQPYRLAIPIGLGDYDTVRTSETVLRAYVGKFEQNVGIELDLDGDRMLRESQLLTPAALFTPCPATPTVLVYGMFDQDETLQPHPEKVPVACREKVRWTTIPLADHMYGTESFRLPSLLRRLYANSSVALLVWRLNRLILHGDEA